MTNLGGKTVLITGASSGFGKLTAQKFQAEGWNVAATMRSPGQDEELTKLERVETFELDVTKPASISAAISRTIKRFGGLHAVVNNAGHGGHGVFEQFTDAEIRSMFETNFFGALSVCRAVLPHFRKQGAGVIVNVTSLAGLVSGPTSGIYAATKFALEGISESMAIEYRQLGIKVCTVAPGAFSTNFTVANKDGTAAIDNELKPYADRLNDMASTRIAEMYDVAPDARMVADKIFECVTEDTPVQNPVGPDAEGVAAALSSMPRQNLLDQMSQSYEFEN